MTRRSFSSLCFRSMCRHGPRHRWPERVGGVTGDDEQPLGVVPPVLRTVSMKSWFTRVRVAEAFAGEPSLPKLVSV